MANKNKNKNQDSKKDKKQSGGKPDNKKGAAKPKVVEKSSQSPISPDEEPAETTSPELAPDSSTFSVVDEVSHIDTETETESVATETEAPVDVEKLLEDAIESLPEVESKDQPEEAVVEPVVVAAPPVVEPVVIAEPPVVEPEPVVETIESILNQATLPPEFAPVTATSNHPDVMKLEKFLRLRKGSTPNLVLPGELMSSGINMSRFGLLEGRVGKFRLNRRFISEGWTITIE